MQFDWRALSGPVLTAATALIAFVVDRHLVAVPNPAPLFVCIVAFAASFSGTASGLTSAVIAVVASALFFLNHRAAPGYDHVGSGPHAAAGDHGGRHRRHHRPPAPEMDRRLRRAAPAPCHGGAAEGGARSGRHRHRAARSRHPRRSSSTAPSATIFSLPDEKADSKPPFIALMYHGRDTGAFELPEDELSALHRPPHRDDTIGRFDADQHHAAGWTRAAVQLHRIARRRAHAELHAGDRPGPPQRRPLQRRLLPVAARRRRRDLARQLRAAE